MIVALEGTRGCGKTHIRKELKKKYRDLRTWKFPTTNVLDELKDSKFDFDSIHDIIKYNMLFLQDFYNYRNVIGGLDLIVVDRYILSHLVHFKYSVLETGKFHWDCLSEILLNMYENWLPKPMLIIYLHGESKQPEPKFDDHLYKDKNLAPYFNSCLSDLKNILNIPFEMVTSQRDDTFTQVESILKTRGLLN